MSPLRRPAGHLRVSIADILPAESDRKFLHNPLVAERALIAVALLARWRDAGEDTIGALMKCGVFRHMSEEDLVHLAREADAALERTKL